MRHLHYEAFRYTTLLHTNLSSVATLELTVAVGALQMIALKLACLFRVRCNAQKNRIVKNTIIHCPAHKQHNSCAYKLRGRMLYMPYEAFGHTTVPPTNASSVATQINSFQWMHCMWLHPNQPAQSAYLSIHYTLALQMNNLGKQQKTAVYEAKQNKQKTQITRQEECPTGGLRNTGTLYCRIQKPLVQLLT